MEEIEPKELQCHVAIYSQTIFCRVDLLSSVDLSQEQQQKLKKRIHNCLEENLSPYINDSKEV